MICLVYALLLKSVFEKDDELFSLPDPELNKTALPPVNLCSLLSSSFVDSSQAQIFNIGGVDASHSQTDIMLLLQQQQTMLQHSIDQQKIFTSKMDVTDSRLTAVENLMKEDSLWSNSSMPERGKQRIARDFMVHFCLILVLI